MSRRTTWLARLLSVATGPLILGGCATQTVVFDPATGPAGTAAQAVRGGRGRGRPRGPSDAPTADIAADLGRRTGFGIVIATGFAIEPDTRERAGRREQVNRPTEGVPGRPPAEEVPTDCAREVYDAYEARVREVARGPLRFLAEIHGNNHRDAAGRIEIATVGVDRELAFRLRALLELIRDAHLQGVAQAPRLDVLIEPADTLHYTASGRCSADSRRPGVGRAWPSSAARAVTAATASSWHAGSSARGCGPTSCSRSPRVRSAATPAASSGSSGGAACGPGSWRTRTPRRRPSRVRT